MFIGSGPSYDHGFDCSSFLSKTRMHQISFFAKNGITRVLLRCHERYSREFKRRKRIGYVYITICNKSFYIGRDGEIRTHDPHVPNVVLYQAELHPD